MAAPNIITPEKLARLIGTPNAPVIIDACIDEDFALDQRIIPGSIRRSFKTVANWSADYAGQSVVAVCQKGQKLGHGVAAWLRHAGANAVTLEGGRLQWAEEKLPMVPVAKIPPRDAEGRTIWVTRARPKIDRIACPWLIRRFVDPAAVFLFVAPAETLLVAERFGGTAFDIEDTYWSHRGPECTFDLMVKDFGLASEPMNRLATIVRAADTGRLDLAPEAPGFLAASLGLSRMYSDDLKQLDAGMALYDAFYRWCRDATDETHNWPSAKP